MIPSHPTIDAHHVPDSPTRSNTNLDNGPLSAGYATAQVIYVTASDRMQITPGSEITVGHSPSPFTRIWISLDISILYGNLVDSTL